MVDDQEPNGQMHEEPTTRLTRICDAMTETFDAHPEYEEGDRCIIFLDDGEQGGIVIHGYESHLDAMTDLLVHLMAMFRANGKQMDIMFLDEDGTHRVNG